MNKEDLIKGRWYTSNSWTSKSYLKFDHYEGVKLYFTERIDTRRHPRHKKENDWWCYMDDIREATLEEIKSHLPNYHPDLIQEFKKGDYIVQLLKTTSKSFLYNYCYKQREDFAHIRPELDCENHEENGWGMISFKGKSVTWRYASKEEIDEYNKRGKPYDVSELTKDVNPNTDFIFEPGGYYVGSWGGGNNVIFKSTTDSLESVNPGISCSGIFSYDTFCTGRGINFRTAAPEEKEWLDLCIRHNKTMPNPKDLVGRYLKALVDSPECIAYAKKGYIFEITELTGIDGLSIKDFHRKEKGSWGASIPKIGTTWELMPIGFNPNNQEEELPEKWGVKVTEENREVLTEWIKKQPNFNENYLPIKGFVLNSYSDKSYQYWGNNISIIGHIEISYETFLKKVFKQGVEPFPLKEAHLKLREAHLKYPVKKEDFITKSYSEKPRKLDPVIYDNNKQEEKQEFLNIKLTKTKSYGNY